MTGSAQDGAIDAGLAARLRRRVSVARILVAPFLVRRRDVERVTDIRSDDAGRHNLLDVYGHRSRPAGCPTLIHLHGGAYRSGSRSREARPLLYRLASQGWVCVSANYRLSPVATFPEHLIDLTKAIAWLREHGHEYGADPTVVFVAGSSAGGYLASLAALTPDPAFQPGFEQVDTSVAAAISLYGYYGPVDGSGGPPSSPLAYLTADAPPFFVAHGDQDTRDRRGRPTLGRAVADHVVQPGRVCGAPWRDPHLRPLPFAAPRPCRRRDRGVRRLGEDSPAGACHVTD